MISRAVNNPFARAKYMIAICVRCAGFLENLCLVAGQVPPRISEQTAPAASAVQGLHRRRPPADSSQAAMRDRSSHGPVPTDQRRIAEAAA